MARCSVPTCHSCIRRTPVMTLGDRFAYQDGLMVFVRHPRITPFVRPGPAPRRDAANPRRVGAGYPRAGERRRRPAAGRASRAGSDKVVYGGPQWPVLHQWTNCVPATTRV
ncbi:hypothetical protein Psuf_076690 [Phytohabitans suffuscus]|uniref:Uncharacterized protein n=1 Tax=Phytohabitans suffuscus TaxID=624315 RepID=A0A6F8YWC2_9ACTN|nr:hypothetical protein Psuf_076690 [Phytohabitans suffuscus]